LAAPLNKTQIDKNVGPIHNIIKRNTLKQLSYYTKLPVNSQLNRTDWNLGARFGSFTVEIILLNHVNLISLTKLSSIPYKISVQHSAEQYSIRSASLQASVVQNCNGRPMYIGTRILQVLGMLEGRKRYVVTSEPIT
jgi:hypothetical protein